MAMRRGFITSQNEESYYLARIKQCREKADTACDPDIRRANESFIRLYKQRMDYLKLG